MSSNALPLLILFAQDMTGSVSLQPANGSVSVRIETAAVVDREAFDSVADEKRQIIQTVENGVPIELRIIQYE